VIEMVRFRGKTINGEWRFGLLSESKGHKGQPEKGFYISNSAGMPWAYRVRSETVGMGVEIGGKWYFEKDIAKCLDPSDEWYESEIRWNGGALTIDVQCCDYDYTAIGWALENDIQEIKIIGTKWDNPELLGGQNEQGD
jgi:hypothetical protein